MTDHIYVHDVIKIMYSTQGYLPNYPPHLISASEMCDAFLKYPTTEGATDEELWAEFLNSSDPQFFRDNYPLVDASFESEYKTLVQEILYHINNLKSSKEDSPTLPDWVYSYMLHTVISPTSDIIDIQDFTVLLGTENERDEYDLSTAQACFQESTTWLRKTVTETTEDKHRPPTIFGEPHVIKALRLRQADLSQ